LQTDDVSIDYTFKRLQQDSNDVIRFLTNRIIQRQLHKIRWSEHPVEENIVAGMVDDVSEKFNLPQGSAAQLVWTGSESNTAYNKDADEILILTKDEEIVPFSSFLDPAIQLSLKRKYFICHPD